VSYEYVDFYVKDTTPSANPMAGVIVKITSQNGQLVYSQATTDVDGHVALLLPTGTYQARFFKFAVGFTNPQFFTVLPSPLQPGQSNIFDIAAIVLTPPIPLDTRLCAAYGYFRDITGAPQSNVDIHFIARFNPVWLEGAGVLKERVTIRTDADGYAQVNLIRNGQYDVTIQGEEDVTRCVSVPDAVNVNLPDLIFPIISRVVLSPAGPYTLAVGEELPLTMTVFSSDGVNRGMAFGDIMIRASNPNVLNYTVSATSLTLIGVGTGTAQIDITRADLSIVHIPDPGIQGQPVQATVT
jgi:hypothetical protein